MRIWKTWVAAVLVVWAVTVTRSGHWHDAVSHWPMAVVMLFGAPVGAATSMGGGSVAFPFLVLVFHRSAAIGRDFAVAVQSIGMTSAFIFLYCRRVPLQARLLFWNLVGAGLGLLAGTYWMAPRVDDVMVKLLFAGLWMSFGLLLIGKNREFSRLDSHTPMRTSLAIRFGLTIGVAGGVAAALIGGGLDMLTYAALLLMFRYDLKIAIPHAVSSMGIASAMANGLHFGFGHVSNEVLFSWMAAAPVALLAAPMGTLVLTVVPRVRMVYAVATLCMIQFCWTLYQLHPSRNGWLWVASVLCAALGAFWLMFQYGRRRSRAFSYAAAAADTLGLLQESD